MAISRYARKREERQPLKRGVLIGLVIFGFLAGGAATIAVIALQPEEEPDIRDVPYVTNELTFNDIGAWVQVIERLAALRKEGRFKTLATTIPAFGSELRAKPDAPSQVCQTMGVKFARLVHTTDAIVSAFILDEIEASIGLEEEEAEPEPYQLETQLPEMPDEVPVVVAEGLRRLRESAPASGVVRSRPKPMLSPLQSANIELVRSQRDRINAAWTHLLEAAPGEE